MTNKEHYLEVQNKMIRMKIQKNNLEIFKIVNRILFLEVFKKMLKKYRNKITILEDYQQIPNNKNKMKIQEDYFQIQNKYNNKILLDNYLEIPHNKNRIILLADFIQILNKYNHKIKPMEDYSEMLNRKINLKIQNKDKLVIKTYHFLLFQTKLF